MLQISDAAAGWDRINIRLTAVDGVTCPKWHADYVGLRLLCTYCGAGTLYVTNDYVTREWVAGGAAVRSVQWCNAVVQRCGGTVVQRSGAAVRWYSGARGGTPAAC
jgi:hypothetical protein